MSPGSGSGAWCTPAAASACSARPRPPGSSEARKDRKYFDVPMTVNIFLHSHMELVPSSENCYLEKREDRNVYNW